MAAVGRRLFILHALSAGRCFVVLVMRAAGILHMICCYATEICHYDVGRVVMLAAAAMDHVLNS